MAVRSAITSGKVWLLACALAIAPAVFGWLAAPYPPPMYGYRVVWLSNIGIAVQLPADLIIGFFAFAVPGGFHNHDYFLKASPFVTWVVYALVFRWLLRTTRPKTQ